MSKLILAVALIFALAIPASAVEFTAPQVPEKGAELMPEDTGSFAAGLMELLRDAVLGLRPDLKEASKVSLGVIAAVMMVSLLQSFSGSVKTVANLAGATAIAAGLLLKTQNDIASVAQAVGYESQSRFTAAFKEAYGELPPEYRRRHVCGAKKQTCDACAKCPICEPENFAKTAFEKVFSKE